MNQYKKSFQYFVFLIPSIALFAFCIVYPFLSGFGLAFTNWDGIARTYDIIYFDNFVKLFSDQNVLQPIKNTLFYGITVTILNNIFALALATVLSKSFRAKAFFKTSIFVPLAISAVLAAFVWRYIDSNILYQVTGSSLLGGRNTVLWGIIIISLWNNLGSNTMIYIAGMTTIPVDYTEAAMIDGANSWQRFCNITLPMLTPSFTVCVTMTLTSSLREFATVMSATGGGPAGSSETFALTIYNYMFKYSRAGYAQAISLVFMVVLVVIGLALNKFFRNMEVEA